MDPVPVLNRKKKMTAPFLSKLFHLLDDSSTDSIISWGKTDNSFVVRNLDAFIEDVLPQHYKHRNYSTFLRQLNVYGFQKPHPELELFEHENFFRFQFHRLALISRKKAGGAKTASPAPPPVGNLAAGTSKSEAPLPPVGNSAAESSEAPTPSEDSTIVEVEVAIEVPVPIENVVQEEDESWAERFKLQELGEQTEAMYAELMKVRELGEQTQVCLREMVSTCERLQKMEQMEQRMVAYLSNILGRPEQLAQLRLRNEHNHSLQAQGSSVSDHEPPRLGRQVSSESQSEIMDFQGNLNEVAPLRHAPLPLCLQNRAVDSSEYPSEGENNIESQASSSVCSPLGQAGQTQDSHTPIFASPLVNAVKDVTGSSSSAFRGQAEKVLTDACIVPPTGGATEVFVKVLPSEKVGGSGAMKGVAAPEGTLRSYHEHLQGLSNYVAHDTRYHVPDNVQVTHCHRYPNESAIGSSNLKVCDQRMIEYSTTTKASTSAAVDPELPPDIELECLLASFLGGVVYQDLSQIFP